MTPVLEERKLRLRVLRYHASGRAEQGFQPSFLSLVCFPRHCAERPTSHPIEKAVSTLIIFKVPKLSFLQPQPNK